MLLFCKKHGLTEHRQRKDGRMRCLKCASDAVQRRREKVKILAIAYKGGKCQMCGYDKCPDALEFHHQDPAQKEFSLSDDGHSRSWDRIRLELDKCILLCCRCHREVHYNMNQKTADVPELIKQLKTVPSVKPADSVTRKHRHCVNKPVTKENLTNALLIHKSFVGAGRSFGVSDNAIRKWCKKYNLPTTSKGLRSMLEQIQRDSVNGNTLDS